MFADVLAKRKELAVFLVIISIAGFFRLYKLSSFPPGLYPDEAMNGNNALQALDEPSSAPAFSGAPLKAVAGGFKIFYPENNGREGLFINIQALSIKIFGIHSWSLRIVSALFGILTVVGLYLLAREIFEWRIAALSSFLLAISFWHVNFSRIGFRAIMLPFIMVYGFYFLWRAIKNCHLPDFILAGIIGGLGFYTYTAYRVVPLLFLVLIGVYWWNIRKDMSFSKYDDTKRKLFIGLALFIFVAFMIALPIGLYFLNHPGSFNSRAGQGLYVFSQPQPVKELANSVIKTLGMFNFTGDWNQRHNLSGEPMLPWPIGIFFVIGFINELVHWIKRKHGHFSTVHTFIFAWFFILLLPGFLSIEAPHALRTIGVLPIVMIITARGLWWSFEKLKIWYGMAFQYNKRPAIYSFINLVMILFLISLCCLEFLRYFGTWGPSSQTAVAFNQNYVNLANEINRLPQSVKKYVLVNAGGVLVNGIPMPSQTVMFLTDTYTPDKQKAKNIFYLTPEQFRAGQFDKGSIIIPLEQ